VISVVQEPIELLRGKLEEQFQRYTDQLTALTVCSRQPDRGGYDNATLKALIATARLAVAESAQALRRMADGTYGICERCATLIPLERLEAIPQARFCVPCQRTRAGSSTAVAGLATRSGRSLGGKVVRGTDRRGAHQRR
jgi:RNA polymerase-binding transcription factor DksA